METSVEKRLQQSYMKERDKCLCTVYCLYCNNTSTQTYEDGFMFPL